MPSLLNHVIFSVVVSLLQMELTSSGCPWHALNFRYESDVCAEMIPSMYEDCVGEYDAEPEVTGNKSLQPWSPVNEAFVFIES
jgi:hypothetical protein